MGKIRYQTKPNPTGVVRNVRESVGGGAGGTRTPVQPPVVLLPTTTTLEANALEELPARDVVLHLLLYATGRLAGESDVSYPFLRLKNDATIYSNFKLNGGIFLPHGCRLHYLLECHIFSVMLTAIMEEGEMSSCFVQDL